MTAFKFEIAKIVGKPAENLWSQVHNFNPDDPEKKEKRGELLAILVLRGVPEGIEAIAAGREVLGRLHEEYYGNLEGSAYERLTAAVRKVCQENENLEIVAAALCRQALYLALISRGKVLLKRGASLGILLNGEGEFKSASGQLQENDQLVLGSGQFFNLIGQGVLRAALENNAPAEVAEALAPMILGRKDVAGVAAVVSLAKKELEMEINPVFPSPETRSEPAPQDVTPALSTQPPSLATPSRFGRKLPKIKIGLPKLKFKSPFSDQPVFVRDKEVQKRKRTFFVLSLALLLLFGGSLVFGFRRQAQEKKKEQAASLLREAQEKLNQGKLAASTDLEEGKVLGQTAQNLASEALTIVGESEEARLLARQSEEFLASLATEVALGEPSVFMDLNLIADGGQGSQLARTGSSLNILDRENKKVYQLNLEKKSHQTIKLDDKAEGLAIVGGKIAIITSSGLELVDGRGADLVQEEDDWGGPLKLSSFGTNLYLLTKKDLWRFAGSGGSFGTAKSWFVEDQELAKAVSMAIDGSIWIAFEDEVKKFNLGREENFSLSKMPEEFGHLTQIYTSEKDNDLYLLDQGKGKIFVVDKKGEFKGAYSWPGFKNASDLVALEDEKKLLVLVKDKLYEVALK